MSQLNGYAASSPSGGGGGGGAYPDGSKNKYFGYGGAGGNGLVALCMELLVS